MSLSLSLSLFLALETLTDNASLKTTCSSPSSESFLIISLLTKNDPKYARGVDISPIQFAASGRRTPPMNTLKSDPNAIEGIAPRSLTVSIASNPSTGEYT